MPTYRFKNGLGLHAGITIADATSDLPPWDLVSAMIMIRMPLLSMLAAEESETILPTSSLARRDPLRGATIVGN